MKEMEECLENIKQKHKKEKKRREKCRWWPKGAFFPILVDIEQGEKRMTTKKSNSSNSNNNNRNSNTKNQVYKNEHVASAGRKES